MRTALKNIAAALVAAMLLAVLALMDQPQAEAGQAGGYPVEPNLRAIRILPSGGALTVKDFGSPQVWMGSAGFAAYTVGTGQLQICGSRDPTLGYCTSGEVDPNPMLEAFPVTDVESEFVAHGIYSMQDNSDPWSFAPLALSTSELMMIRLNRGGANDFAVPALQFSVGATQHRLSSLLDQEADTLAPLQIRASSIALDAPSITFNDGGSSGVDLAPLGVVYNTGNCAEVNNLGNTASEIDSCTENATGTISLVFANPYDAVPVCTASAIHATGGFGMEATIKQVLVDEITVETEDSGGDLQDSIVSIICHGLHST